MGEYWKDEAIKLVDAFAAKSGTSTWPKLHRDRVAEGLIERINDPDKVNQGNTSLCGPASIMRNVAADQPMRYAQAGIDLFETGKSKALSLPLAPGPKVLEGKPDGTPEVDYMMLASVRDADNWFFSPNGALPNLAGMTLPSTMKKWFVQAGYTDIYEEAYLSKFEQQYASARNQINQMEAYLVAGYRVVMLIDSDMLHPDDQQDRSFIPDHWVTLLTPIGVERPVNDDSSVWFDVFTWGAKKSITKHRAMPLTFWDFRNHFYGYIAALP